MTEQAGPKTADGKFRLPRWSLKNPTLVVLLTIVFTVWGGYNYFTMSRREDPEIKISVALVVTIYPGASADKVEQNVTRKLEDAIESMDNLAELESTSRPNLSVIFVTVRYDADAQMEWQKLRSKIDEAKGDLPSSVIGPDVMDDFGDTTGMIIALTGADPVRLADIAEELQGELRHVQSVGDIDLYGKLPEVVYLEGHRADMARYGITPVQVSKALEMHNVQIPAGSIRTDRYQFRVEPTGSYDAVGPIADTIIDISEKTGQPVHVRDVFEVTRETKNPPDTKLLRNGETAVTLGLVMKRGYNIVKMGEEVEAVLEEFAPRLPPGVNMEVLHDSPRQVNSLVQDFMSNLLEGVAIVIVVMALFMGIRSATISAVAIPMSILIALALMPIMDIDLEIVSIGAFIVALGMLVDNSIIVADNVDIKLREGKSPFEAAWRGTVELTRPVIVGTLATVVAFLPMLLLSGETGAYVRSLPLVVAISLVGSLVLSQTVTPLMAKWMLRKPKKIRGNYEDKKLGRVYRTLMRGCLKNRFAVVIVAVLSLAAAGWMLFAVGFSFFPDAQRDQFTVDIWLKESSAIAETEKVARQAEKLLHENEEVEGTLVYVGKGGPRFYITVMPEFQKSNYAQIMVNTKSPEATFRVIDRFNEKARKNFPGARVFAKKLVMGMPIAAPVAFRITGDDLTTLRRIGEKIQDILRDIPGTDQVKNDLGPDIPSLKVDVSPERANRVGITNTDVALAFLSTYEGFPLTQFPDGDEEIPVVLRLVDEERTIDQDLTNLPVASNITHKKVPLGSFAEIEPDWSPGVIKRRNNQRTLSVLSWTRDRLANDIVMEAWPEVQKLDLPEGYRVEITGEKEEMDKAFGELLIVFGVILVSLLALLVFQLGTLRRTFIVLLSVPLSAVGAALGLYVGGYSFSFMAFLGVISLAGMAIKNSVVWIEFVEQARREGASRADAIIRAGIYRLRPIMLTTATTVGGLLPLALFGGVLFEPMAWAMIVGLTLVTVYTLIAIPVFYDLLMPKENLAANKQAPA